MDLIFQYIDIRFAIHYSLHFLAPMLLAYLFFKEDFKKAYLLMVGTMLVDVDHLMANPIFDPNRCSVGFHYLHSYPAITLYFFMLMFPKTRIIAVGLLFHMVTDYLDCLWI